MDEGVRTVVTTPHLAASLTRRPQELWETMGRMDQGWEALTALAEDGFPHVRVLRGVELRLDRRDPDLSDPRLRLGGTSAILMEFDAFLIPRGAEQVLTDIAAQGWTPVLAHPERYMGATVARLHSLRRTGALFQINAGSLVGRYGPDIKALAWRLLKEGMGTIVGSDWHGHRQLHVGKARDMVRGRMGADAAWRLFHANGERILEEQMPLPVVPRRVGRLLGRITGWLKSTEGGRSDDRP